MTKQKEKRPEIWKVSVEFSQDGNTLGTTDENEELKIDLEFQLGEAGGPFYVLTSKTGWSINDTDEIQKLMDIAESPLKKIRETYPEDQYETGT